jgi:hypothetical protein
MTGPYASYEHEGGVEVLSSASAVPFWLVWFGFVHFWGHFQGVVLRIKTKRYSETFAANLTPKMHQTNVVEECYTVRLSIGTLQGRF